MENPLESLPASGSTLEEFAVYYLNLVKLQTDEFIKSSTSTCNTPRKLTNVADNAAMLGTMTSNVTQQAINDKRMLLGDCGVNGMESLNAENDEDIGNDDGGSSSNVNKRQISRELFVVDKQQNNNSVGVGYGNVLARNKGSNFNSSTFGSSNSNYYETTTTTTTFAENESPNAMSRKSNIAAGDLEIEGGAGVSCGGGGGKLDFVIGMNKTSTSTPLHSSSFSKVNRSIDDPTLTSTPNSFRINNSFSLDHSGIVKGNSIKRNQLNDSNNSNSMSRRNTTSSPMCLGDFMNVSGNSGKGSRKKSIQQSTPNENCSVFSSNDFPSLSGSVPQKRLTPISVPAAPTVIATATAQPIEVRPKKRVVPMTISRRTIGSGTGNTVGGNVINSSFVSSSFQQENNLLNVMSFETDPRSDVMSERRMLRDCRDAITKDFTREQEPARHLHAFIKETLPSSAGDVKAPGTPRKLSIFKYHEEMVVEKEMLLRMSRIYSFLMDMNLIPNILTELSYLINLLNTDHDPYEQITPQSTDKSSMLLKNLTNCIYFTTHTLIAQRNVLALLDITTIRVLIDNERIQQLPVLFEHLKLFQQRKVQLEDVALTLAHKNQLNGSISGGNVFFQQETDNRDNFPSDREFGAFKKQRDMFYSILRAWEFKHLDPTWEFQPDLGMKVRQLLMVLEHPINMAHLAKLFVAQLMISCNFDNSANELQMVLPGIDLSKLSKLRQRLVAPSTFSTQYLFPGSQAFFRDFIQCCDYHLMFIEQLKIALISELLQMNDSSYEILSIVNDGVPNSNTIVSTANPDDDKDQNLQDFIVRAETLTTMRVLAKFVGFVVSRPFGYDGYRNVLVDQKQSKIRNLLHPDFDVKSVLLKAIECRKLLVTLPWLVQYLSMLDFITIRLDYYRETFQMMYMLYMQLNDIESHQKYCVMPTSKFIIRTCLGWLFEHPNVPEEYYNYQSTKREVDLVMRKSKRKPIVPGSDVVPLNPLLESILDAACPFLADFRVSVMPSKFTKTVSRTGRYRHITTKYSDTSKVQNKSKVQDNHQKLVEAFLQSQSLSVKKTVDFVIERVTSAVVKDFQVKQLLGIRKQAKLEVDQLKRSDLETLTKSMFAIYNKSLEQLQIKWNEEFQINTRKRVQESFDALLPFETLDAVKKTLIELTVEKTHDKVNEWRITNISTLALFSKDIQGDAAKVLKNNPQLNNNRNTQSMVLDLKTSMVPSDYFFQFQKLLHYANLYPGHLKSEDLTKFLDVSMEIINKQVFPTNSYRTVAFYLLQLVHSIVANRPELLTKEILEKFIDLWQHEKLKLFTFDDVETPKMTASNFIFSSVISPRFILTMNKKPRKTFELFSNVLIELVNKNFLNLEHINEQSVRLYKNEWDKETLDNIAFMIEHVSNSIPTNNTDLDQSESKLFLDLVADLARDMEDF